MTQETVFLIFLVGAAVILILMVVIAMVPRAEPAEYAALALRGYAVRRWWLRGLLVAIALALAVSIPFFPYPKTGAAAPRIRYHVIAQQYGFLVPSTVPLGKRVDFAVTSSDVNHGFGIYDPQGRLVGQVQAMPHYINHLQMTFTQRGTYTVRCLEYCGIGHAYMHTQFEVR